MTRLIRLVGGSQVKVKKNMNFILEKIIEVSSIDQVSVSSIDKNQGIGIEYRYRVFF